MLVLILIGVISLVLFFAVDVIIAIFRNDDYVWWDLIPGSSYYRIWQERKQ